MVEFVSRIDSIGTFQVLTFLALLSGVSYIAYIFFKDHFRCFEDSVLLIITSYVMSVIIWGLSFNVFTLSVVLVFIFLKLLPIRINAESLRTHVSYSRVSLWAIWGGCVLLVLFTSTLVHYDYFHGTINSIDLFLNETSPSIWLSQFNNTYWPILTQTLLPVLDSTELYVTNGKISTLFPLLLLALLGGAIIHRIDGGWPSYVAGLVVLIYMIDFSMAPRPHVILGFSASLFILEVMQSKRISLMAWVSLVLMIFAKRDGVVLAFFLVLFFFCFWLFVRFRNKFKYKHSRLILPFISFMALLFVAAEAMRSWVVIRGFNLLEVVLKVFDISSLIQVLLKFESILVLSLVVTTIACIMILKDRYVKVVATVFIIFCSVLVLGSALILEVLGQYNHGTIARKVFYIFLPVMFFLLLGIKLRLNKKCIFFNFGVLLIFMTILYYWVTDFRNNALALLNSKSNNSYVKAHEMLSVLGEHDKPIFLVSYKKLSELNKEPEIAKLIHYSGGTGYIFPYLTALNGKELHLITLDDFCSMKDFDSLVAIITPQATKVLSETSDCKVDGKVTLASGYSIAAGPEVRKNFFKFWPEEQVNSNLFITSPWKVDMFMPSQDWKISTRPWGKVSQFMVISKKKKIELEFFQDDHLRKGWLVFQQHPLLVEPPKISIIEPGLKKSFQDSFGSYVVPLSAKKIVVEFEEKDFLKPYQGYVWFMHNPRVRMSTSK